MHAAAVRGGKAHAAQACAKVAAIDGADDAGALLPNEVNEGFDQESIAGSQNARRGERDDLVPEIALDVVKVRRRLADRPFRLRCVHAVRKALRVVLDGAGGLGQFKRCAGSWHQNMLSTASGSRGLLFMQQTKMTTAIATAQMMPNGRLIGASPGTAPVAVASLLLSYGARRPQPRDLEISKLMVAAC